MKVDIFVTDFTQTKQAPLNIRNYELKLHKNVNTDISLC